MNLFIDTISSKAHVFIFDDSREIIDNISWDVIWNESSTITPKIDELLEKNNIWYNNIKNIVIVNWPGSFTWVRTSILAANSINYVINKNMTAISYFDLFTTYPIVKASSKRDCFIQRTKDSEIEIVQNDILTKEWINIEWLEKIDYKSIIKKIKFDNLKQVWALYIKKPNIS